MKLNLLKSSLAMAACLVAARAGAYSFSVDDVYYNIVSETDRTVEVTNDNPYGNTYLGNVVIPESVENDGKTYAVVAIGNQAFYDSSNLKSVTIPSTVTRIGSGAFSDCQAIDNIELPDAITEIPDHAFYNCIKLTYINIPEGVTSIGDYAFGECAMLTDRILPAGLLSIGTGAFSGCMAFTEVYIPAACGQISDLAFYACMNLIAINVEEDNPNYMSDDGVFYNKEQTVLYQYPAKRPGTSYDVPSTVKTLASYAFNCCQQLTRVSIPDSVTEMGEGCFFYCDALTDLRLSAGLTSIPAWSFAFCQSLTGFQAMSGVTSVGDDAFFNCSALREVSFPASMLTMGDEVLASCASLQSVTCLASAPPACTVFTFDTNNYSAILCVPEEYRGAYAAAIGWDGFTKVQGITGIESAVVEDTRVYGCCGTLVIESPEATVRVSDTAGHLIYIGPATTLSGLPHGLYFVTTHSRTLSVFI